MKSNLKMQLYSEHEMTADQARVQIEALSAFQEGVFRPEKCDTSEPLKEVFNISDISEPIRWLSHPGADFKFKKSKPFKFEGFISNRRYPPIWTKETKGGPLVPKRATHQEPRFLTSWTVWIDQVSLRALGAGVLKQFIIQMFSSSRSEYGFLSTESDQKRKNFLVRQLSEGSTSSKFVGTDPEHGIPGLYWLNLFGPKYVSWLGSAIRTVPGEIQAIDNGGISLQFGASPEDAEQDEVITQERIAIGILGPEKFFDINQPDRKPISPFFYQ
jgi:hypothetical protein